MSIDIKLILENSKGLSVLYVEDDDELRESTLKLLKNFFARVDTAVDGLQGYEKYQSFLEKESSNYDIVLSDISMPNMDGIEMAENIKALCSEQVIIFITAFQNIENLQNAINIGSNGFLIKPINIEELKQVLYTTTQIVADRKLIRSHYQQIADENQLSLHLADTSDYNSPKNILNDLERSIEKISILWVEQTTVQSRLEKYNIDKEFFRTRYAVNVIVYFVGVIKEENELGNCPVIIVMLDFLKAKEFLLEDLYMICSGFKNILLNYIFSSYTYKKHLIEDIAFILDSNFEGVITNYLEKRACNKKEKIVLMTKKDESISSESVAGIDVSYSEYVLENDIYELYDLEEEIDKLAIFATSENNASLQNSIDLGNAIEQYGTVLSNYPIFVDLGESIIKLGSHLFQNAEMLFHDKEKMQNISALLEAFVNDLIVWRKEIFENNIEDYQFLNSSFFSNVDTIIMFIDYDENQEESAEGSEIDFF